MTEGPIEVTAAKRGGHKWWITAIVGSAALFVGIGIGAAGSESGSDEAMDTTTTIAGQPADTTTTTAAPTTTAATTTSTTQAVTIGVDDFEVILVEIENQCFDTAGSIVTMIAELGISDSARNGTGTWLVVYEVAPLSGGSSTYNTEVDLDDGTYSKDTLSLSTDVCTDRPAATVTNVIEN